MLQYTTDSLEISKTFFCKEESRIGQQKIRTEVSHQKFSPTPYEAHQRREVPKGQFSKAELKTSVLI